MSQTQDDRVSPLDVEAAVRERYGASAKAREAALCCPIDYERSYLQLLPEEILEKDYGCGDPSKYVEAGETVLDLGSGGGKICYILSQKVGSEGRVIGVDMNDDMLALAEKYRGEMAERIGWANVEFRKGRIQDLRSSLQWADSWLGANQVGDSAAWGRFEAALDEQRREQPLIANDSIDVIVSNCVLNLVAPEQKAGLFDEMFRVLRRGGRCVISDIVCDEEPSEAMKHDPTLWSGCISGAFREDEFLQRFERAGFYGIEILERQAEPWQVVQGIEFRSMTVRAYKGKDGPCLDRKQAVVYRGPWKRVVDDDGHSLRRGERMAVCDKTYRIYTDANGPYAGQFEAIDPYEDLAIEDAEAFVCDGRVRDPRETKGAGYDATRAASDCCAPEAKSEGTKSNDSCC